MDIEQDNFLKNFGSRLSLIRKQKGITQEKLADKVGLHRTYIGFIEQGKRNPSIANINKVAKALDINLSELFKTF
ncbi:MAG: helix-turn-helix transcriptional regulator [Candidatus Saccharibacteria bacterium]